ncbi:MAG: hypothetical protein GY716_02320 [bacterium]|nr:hypothetical protein [bacterium]
MKPPRPQRARPFVTIAIALASSGIVFADALPVEFDPDRILEGTSPVTAGFTPCTVALRAGPGFGEPGSEGRSVPLDLTFSDLPVTAISLDIVDIPDMLDATSCSSVVSGFDCAVGQIANGISLSLTSNAGETIPEHPWPAPVAELLYSVDGDAPPGPVALVPRNVVVSNSEGLDCVLNVGPRVFRVTRCADGSQDGDTDGDGTWNCVDGCPDDPLKVEPGECGCGVPDADGDGDGVFDCLDLCPEDPDKVEPGLCGCNEPDDPTDTDYDGYADCIDQCPEDPSKTEPGICGCGEPDHDSDSDGTPNCNDECPYDADRVEPGVCGCGVSDVDTDGDGTPDCVDLCPDDPDKTEPGICGCVAPDVDSDGDGPLDCDDGCPHDPDKFLPGECGCGVPETDSDVDGAPDCVDDCPDNPLIIVAGSCGCDAPDSDGDGASDCDDGCPDDPQKVEPGLCGCGAPETDSDGDVTPDCVDGCPSDPTKTEPGACGCGEPDTDADGDDIPDCFDPCITGEAQDPDEDGVCGDDDNCPEDYNPDQADEDDDGLGNACDFVGGSSSSILSVVPQGSTVQMFNVARSWEAQSVPALAATQPDDWRIGGPIVFPEVPIDLFDVLYVEQVGQAAGDHDPITGEMTLSLPINMYDSDGDEWPATLELTTGATNANQNGTLICNTPPAPGDPSVCQGSPRDAAGNLRMVSLLEVPPGTGLLVDGSTYRVEVNLTLPRVDSDGDGIEDFDDNCPTLANAGQADEDNDGLGNVCEAIPPSGGLDCYPSSRYGWSVSYVDSQQLVGEDGRATNAIDGDQQTSWVTQWAPTSPDHPHEIVIDTGGLGMRCGFSYLPRQDGGINGTIRGYEFALSPDGENWNTVSSGVLLEPGMSLVEQHIGFPPAPGRFLRLRSLGEINGGPWAVVAELNTRYIPPELLGPPEAAIDAPVEDLAIDRGAVVEFAGTGIAEEDGQPLTFWWSFPDCAAPALAFEEDAGRVAFDCPPGDYLASFVVCSPWGCSLAQRSIRVLGVGCAPLSPDDWIVIDVDSEQIAFEYGAAGNAIDGDPLTNWVTEWLPASPGHPHEIRIDTGNVQTLCGFSYLPRQDGGVNGNIQQFEFAVSPDGLQWSQVAGGAFFDVLAPPNAQVVEFQPVLGRYVQLRSLSALYGGPWAVVAELGLSGPTQTSSLPPSVAIDLPADDVLVDPGSSVSFASTANAPDDELPLSLWWRFPDCAVPSTSEVEDPGAVVFDCPPGDYLAELSVCDAAGACTEVERGVTVSGPPCAELPKDGWSVVYVDSEETIAEDGRAVNAIDGDPSTLWVTRWTPYDDPMPHEIRIDLGSTELLCGFSVLPRQDGGVNGTIRAYELEISEDEVNWTTVANGELSDGVDPIARRQILFGPASGRFVRLRALSDIGGGPWAVVSELGVLANRDGTDD